MQAYLHVIANGVRHDYDNSLTSLHATVLGSLHSTVHSSTAAATTQKSLLTHQSSSHGQRFLVRRLVPLVHVLSKHKHVLNFLSNILHKSASPKNCNVTSFKQVKCILCVMGLYTAKTYISIADSRHKVVADAFHFIEGRIRFVYIFRLSQDGAIRVHANHLKL